MVSCKSPVIYGSVVHPEYYHSKKMLELKEEVLSDKNVLGLNTRLSL
jgi:hypothetical protein